MITRCRHLERTEITPPAQDHSRNASDCRAVRRRLLRAGSAVAGTMLAGASLVGAPRVSHAQAAITQPNNSQSNSLQSNNPQPANSQRANSQPANSQPKRAQRALAQPTNALTLAAASDLKFALEDVVPLFERASGERVRLVFGSSGTFFAQIRQGAPFHVFMSADEDFVFRLADAGKTRDRGRLYAVGRIGLIVPKGSALRADPTLDDLALALRDGRLRRFAIANPEHAPYGARAREALRHRGLWDTIEPKLVLGENISQATQFALSGSTQGGITALSLARAGEVASRSDFALLPADWHAPLRQRMVALAYAPPSAQAFCDFMTTAPVLEVMARYGFERPAAN